MQQRKEDSSRDVNTNEQVRSSLPWVIIGDFQLYSLQATEAEAEAAAVNLRPESSPVKSSESEWAAGIPQCLVSCSLISNLADD